MMLLCNFEMRILHGLRLLPTPKKVHTKVFHPRKVTAKFQTKKSHRNANFNPQKGLHTSPSLSYLSASPGVLLDLPFVLSTLRDHIACTNIPPEILKSRSCLQPSYQQHSRKAKRKVCPTLTWDARIQGAEKSERRGDQFPLQTLMSVTE